jgi:hypothetical protein
MYKNFGYKEILSGVCRKGGTVDPTQGKAICSEFYRGGYNIFGVFKTKNISRCLPENSKKLIKFGKKQCIDHGLNPILGAFNCTPGYQRIECVKHTACVKPEMLPHSHLICPPSAGVNHGLSCKTYCDLEKK